MSEPEMTQPTDVRPFSDGGPAVQQYPWIHADLQHLARPIGQFRQHPRNARRHPKRNLDEISASLREHGQVQALIVTTRPMVLHGDVVSPPGTILVGNGRFRAAQQNLQWTHIAAIGFTGTDLDARKLALRDNRTSELAEWEYQDLGLELRELGDLHVDLDSIGWTDDEAAPLLEAEFSPGGPTGSDPSGGAGGVGGNAKPGIHLTDAQRQVVDRACDDCRRRRNNPALTQAECLAAIAQEYLDAGRAPG